MKMKKKTLLSLVSLGAVALIGAGVLAGCGAQNGITTTNNSSASSTVSSEVTNEIDVNTATGAKILNASIDKFNSLTQYRTDISVAFATQMPLDDNTISESNNVGSVVADVVNGVNGAKPDVSGIMTRKETTDDEVTTASVNDVIIMNDGTDVYTSTNEEDGDSTYVHSNYDATGLYDAVTYFNINAFKDAADLFTNEGLEDGKIKLVAIIGAKDTYKVNLGDTIALNAYLDFVDVDTIQSQSKVEILIDSETLLPVSMLYNVTELMDELRKASFEEADTIKDAAITSYYDYSQDGDIIVKAPSEFVEAEEITETADGEEAEVIEETAE